MLSCLIEHDAERGTVLPPLRDKVVASPHVPPWLAPLAILAFSSAAAADRARVADAGAVIEAFYRWLGARDFDAAAKLWGDRCGESLIVGGEHESQHHNVHQGEPRRRVALPVRTQRAVYDGLPRFCGCR